MHLRPGAVLHVLGRLLIQFQVAGQLAAGQALIGVEHEANGKEPLLKQYPGLFHDGARHNIEADMTGIAVPAAHARSVHLPNYTFTVAMGTPGSFAPTYAFQVFNAGFLIRKSGDDANEIHG